MRAELSNKRDNDDNAGKTIIEFIYSRRRIISSTYRKTKLFFRKCGTKNWFHSPSALAWLSTRTCSCSRYSPSSQCGRFSASGAWIASTSAGPHPGPWVNRHPSPGHSRTPSCRPWRWPIPLAGGPRCGMWWTAALPGDWWTTPVIGPRGAGCGPYKEIPACPAPIHHPPWEGNEKGTQLSIAFTVKCTGKLNPKAVLPSDLWRTPVIWCWAGFDRTKFSQFRCYFPLRVASLEALISDTLPRHQKW